MDRFEWEQKMMPQLFYGDCRSLVESVEEMGEGYFAEIYKEFDPLFADTRAFDAGVLDYDGDVNLCRIFLPKSNDQKHCAAIYLIYGDDFKPLSYVNVKPNSDGGFKAFTLDEELRESEFGRFELENEKGIIDQIVDRIGSDPNPEELEREGMKKLLRKHGIPFYDEEVDHYRQMFSVIDELTESRLTDEEMVITFSQLTDPDFQNKEETSGGKIKAAYDKLGNLPETSDKLEHKHKLFFAFCVYAACSFISENDVKPHHFMGIAEFESADYIKFSMEEYWALDPYMFDVR